MKDSKALMYLIVFLGIAAIVLLFLQNYAPYIEKTETKPASENASELPLPSPGQK